MVMMMNCAMDWTYDMYLDDVKKYNIEDKNSHNYNAYFVAVLKESVEQYISDWKATHNNHLYDIYEGYVGENFVEDSWDWFSDFYKDTYGQRPHLAPWFYVHALNLPHKEDTARLFCANPVENAVENAKYAREQDGIRSWVW